MSKGQHVIRAVGGGWSVRTTGAAKASKTFPTQEAAIVHGRALAQKNGAELYIHRADGTISERSSYAPSPAKG